MYNERVLPQYTLEEFTVHIILETTLEQRHGCFHSKNVKNQLLLQRGPSNIILQVLQNMKL
jgi:hypothetical protein